MKRFGIAVTAVLMITAMSLTGCNGIIPEVSDTSLTPTTAVITETSETATVSETTVPETTTEETTTASETTTVMETTKETEPEKLPGQDFDVREELYKFRNDETVKQVLFIRCEEGTKAHAQYLVKDVSDDGKATWKIARECDAYIGLNGPGKTKEGDTKTPLGVFGVRSAFGIKSNPGTKLTYTSITPDTYACGCEKYYNRIIDAKVTGHKCTEGEQMYFYSPEYNYGLETDYNPGNEPGKGSAIFIHCMGVKPYTGGCVALPEDDMKYIIQNCDPTIKIIIQKF